MEEIKETKNHNSAWKKLISEYKKLLEKAQEVAFDGEAYKWEIITGAKNLAGKKLLAYLKDIKSNLFDPYAIGETNLLLKTNVFNSIYKNLIDEKIELNIRLKNFKDSILLAYSKSGKHCQC